MNVLNHRTLQTLSDISEKEQNQHRNKLTVSQSLLFATSSFFNARILHFVIKDHWNNHTESFFDYYILLEKILT